jgi:hypothetical protein
MRGSWVSICEDMVAARATATATASILECTRYLRMLIARAATRRTVVAELPDSSNINALAQ